MGILHISLFSDFMGICGSQAILDTTMNSSVGSKLNQGKCNYLASYSSSMGLSLNIASICGMTVDKPH